MDITRLAYGTIGCSRAVAIPEQVYQSYRCRQLTHRAVAIPEQIYESYRCRQLTHENVYTFRLRPLNAYGCGLVQASERCGRQWKTQQRKVQQWKVQQVVQAQEYESEPQVQRLHSGCRYRRSLKLTK